MDINVTFDSSAITAPAGFEADVEAVAKFYDSQFSNPITINIDVGWGEVDGQSLSADDLGESESNYTTSAYTYAQIKTALDNNALTSQAQGAVATLPGPDPTGGGEFTMTTAEAKALGLMGVSSAVDGWAGFTSEAGTFDFAITSNTSTAVVPESEYDFFAVVAHEFSEIMGRQMNFGINYGQGPGDGSGYYPLDLFDYSAPGVRSFNQSASDRYFSVDGGATNLDNFNTQSTGDLFDWANSAGNDAYDAFANPGVVNQVTATDLELMNIIGYQPTPAFNASALSISGLTLTFQVDDDSQGAAAASTTGIYASLGLIQATSAGTLVATVATPAIAGDGSTSGDVTVDLSSLTPGFYSLGAIADYNGAVVQSNTSSNVSLGSVSIGILDTANAPTFSDESSVYYLDIGGLDINTAVGIGTLYVNSLLGGTGELLVGSSITLAPGTKLSVAKLDLDAGTANVDTDLTYAGTLTGERSTTLDIAGGDTLELTGADDNFYATVAGEGTLAVGGGASVLDSGASLTVARFTVSGAKTAVSIDTNLIYARDWDQTAGSVSVASDDTFKLTGAADVLVGTLTGAGTVDLTGAGDTLKDVTLSAARIKIDAASVNVAGAIDLTGLLSLTSPDVVIETGAIARLTGGGTVALSEVSTNEIVGATASAILQNSDRIEGAGDLGGGQLKLANEAGGIIEGNAAQALVIDASLFTNAGLVEAVGAGGLAIDGAVDNTGTLSALGSDLAVDGAVTGAGTVRVSGGTAAFAAAFSQNVAFTSLGGVLELADATAYAGTISGFSKTGASSLDLEDISFATATKSYSGTAASGVLTVTDGTHTVKIKLAGNYLASVWTLSSDGHGGTTVVDPASVTPSAHVMAGAMAGFAPAAAGDASGAQAAASHTDLLLAASLR